MDWWKSSEVAYLTFAINSGACVAEVGMTMVVITRKMRFTREVGTKVLSMDDGNIMGENTPQEFFSNPQSPRLKGFCPKCCRRKSENKV